MEFQAKLLSVDGRKLAFEGQSVEVFLRRNVHPSNAAQHIGKVVEVVTEVDKGYEMLKEIKPTIPETLVEKTPAQPQQAPSQHMTTADAAVKGTEFAQKPQPRTQKDMDIMHQWSYGQATQATWAGCNDALVLSTEQMKERIRDLAAWYRNEILSR